ncbi:MAG TPA: hypothetical protein VHO29_04410, partial [Marmoricola sp.]|nr:hypothetical protein [Marmoricola sp.]
MTTVAPGVGVAAPPTARAHASKKTRSAAKVSERPDRVSAMVTARAQKSRVEDLSSRTPTTATYANPDGTWTTESHAGVVRSKADDDTWVPVDASVEKRGNAFEPKAAPYGVRFSGGGGKTLGSVTT